MSSLRFADLRLLARHLGRSDPYRNLPKMLDQAVRAQSCHADLKQAAAALSALDDLLSSPRRRGTIAKNATEQALLMSGVILYARATSTNSGKGERGSVSVQAQLDAELHKDHAALIRIRNRAIAHVYLQDRDQEGLVWHEDRPFLQADAGEETWHVGVAARSTQLHRPTIERLRRLLPPATRIMRERFLHRIDAVTMIINANPVPADLVEQFGICAAHLFGSDEAAQAALAGRAAGEASFYSLEQLGDAK